MPRARTALALLVLSATVCIAAPARADGGDWTLPGPPPPGAAGKGAPPPQPTTSGRRAARLELLALGIGGFVVGAGLVATGIALAVQPECSRAGQTGCVDHGLRSMSSGFLYVGGPLAALGVGVSVVAVWP